MLDLFTRKIKQRVETFGSNDTLWCDKNLFDGWKGRECLLTECIGVNRNGTGIDHFKVIVVTHFFNNGKIVFIAGENHCHTILFRQIDTRFGSLLFKETFGHGEQQSGTVPRLSISSNRAAVHHTRKCGNGILEVLM